jgi:hypothetical protein
MIDKSFKFLILEEEMRKEKLEKAAAMLSMAENPEDPKVQKLILDEVDLNPYSLTREEVEYLLSSFSENF